MLDDLERRKDVVKSVIRRCVNEHATEIEGEKGLEVYVRLRRERGRKRVVWVRLQRRK